MTAGKTTAPFSPASAPIVVLKFGSSVLTNRSKIPEAVSEIYRFVRAGRRVVAVTSAYAGVTDKLLNEAGDLGCAHDNINAPAYVALGEETSAAMLALACDRSGLCSIALKTAELGLRAEGPHDEAEPSALEDATLRRALERNDVVVVPGYVATSEDGRTVLLGRGGSDLTAVYLAHALNAERVRLLKDVDGVYDGDPAKRSGAQRFTHIGWEHALQVAAPLIQPRALSYAAKHNVAIEVGAVGSGAVTLVGADDGRPFAPAARRKLRVAIAGFGVVGAGVAQRILGRRDAFEIVSVLIRDPSKPRDPNFDPSLFTTLDEEFLAGHPDVVVDALSSGDVGAQLSEKALRLGIHVVSANKQAVASAHAALTTIARRTGAQLYYSAAVGGGAPLLETLAEAPEGEIDVIEGVLNGTVNYLLERLAQGAAFEEALAAARKAGLAEEDPSADLEGRDAAAKLILLSLAAFGAAPGPADLKVESMGANVIKRAERAKLRQVARLTRASDGALSGEIRFETAEATPFTNLGGDRNALYVRTSTGRAFTARGRGAGRWPTTESVFADLVDLSACLERVREEPVKLAIAD